mgnify:CR=1 FL=1
MRILTHCATDCWITLRGSAAASGTANVRNLKVLLETSFRGSGAWGSRSPKGNTPPSRSCLLELNWFVTACTACCCACWARYEPATGSAAHILTPCANSQLLAPPQAPGGILQGSCRATRQPHTQDLSGGDTGRMQHSGHCSCCASSAAFQLELNLLEGTPCTLVFPT